MMIDRRGFIGGSVSAALALAASGCAARAKRAGKRWYKGNLHTHTLVSDGDAFPVEAALLYRDLGYNFLMFSDHDLVHDHELWVNEKNHRRHTFKQASAERFAKAYPAFSPRTRTDEGGIKTWHIGQFDETAAQVDVPGRFLLMSGCEYNDAIEGRLQLHCQAINTRHDYKYQKCKTLQESYERQRAHFDRVTAGEDAVFAVNHPLWWLYDVDPLLLSERDELQFFEVANSPARPDPAVVARGAYDEDRIWDFALARRCRRGAQLLYGLATDDTHSYGSFYDELAGKPGRRHGWVSVRCEELSASAIVAALRRGDFYASTGVDLEDVAFEGGRLSVRVKDGTADEYLIRFYGTKTGANLDDYDPGRLEPITEIFRREGAKGVKIPRYVGTERRIARLPADVGIVLQETVGASASYALKPNDLYVRAKVIRRETGEVAWSQPFRRGS